MMPLTPKWFRVNCIFLGDLVAHLEVGSNQHFMSQGSILPPFAPFHESGSLIHCFYNKGLFTVRKGLYCSPKMMLCITEI